MVVVVRSTIVVTGAALFWVGFASPPPLPEQAASSEALAATPAISAFLALLMPPLFS